MRSAGFWNFRQREWQFVTDVSGQSICHIFKGQSFHWLMFEDGNDRLSRNVGNNLPIYAA